MFDDISSWFSDLFSSPTSEYVDPAATLGSSSMFSPQSMESMLGYGSSAPFDFSGSADPLSFSGDSLWPLTPQADAAGGYFGTNPMDFMDLNALINSPLAQTDLWSVNPFDEANDSWMSTGLDYLNPALSEIDNLAKFRAGLTDFTDASASSNSAYDFMAEALGIPRPSTLTGAQRTAAAERAAQGSSGASRQQGSQQGTSRASDALQSALKAASMAGTLYKLATGDNGLSAEDVARRDSIRDLGPNFGAAQAKRSARGYKKGGKILDEGGAHGGLLQLAAAIAEIMHSQMPGMEDDDDLAGGQDDVIDIKAAPGEYVFDADIVAAIGDGDNDAGAKRLDKMRQNIRAHKRGGPVTSIPPRAKSLKQYMGD